MGRSYDEPFTLYGLLAESIDTDAARTYVEFTLREEARFSDGSPVTVEDVMWSFETLGTVGSPRYHGAWKKIATMEQTGPRSIRFTFNETDRELPLILGLRPVLQKAQWEGRDFAETTLDAPIGSGPYVVDQMEPGVFISYRRNPDWWGKDLAFNKGQWNFDEIRYDYFANPLAIFETFKAGELSSFREGNAGEMGRRNYDFPAVLSGDVIKAEIPHQRPSGIEGLVFNTRKPMFSDWRVREALILAFNFEFINQTMTGGTQPRIPSYFGNSFLAMEPGAPADGPCWICCSPLPPICCPARIEGYALPVSDGRPGQPQEHPRRNAPCWKRRAGPSARTGSCATPRASPSAFEILLVTGQDDMAADRRDLYRGAEAAWASRRRSTMVDDAQYKQRTNAYDFDMTHYIRSLSLSPGNEQMLYWGSAGVTEPGTRNWMGMNSPAAEAMIATMLTAPDAESLQPRHRRWTVF